MTDHPLFNDPIDAARHVLRRTEPTPLDTDSPQYQQMVERGLTCAAWHAAQATTPVHDAVAREQALVAEFAALLADVETVDDIAYVFGEGWA